MQNMPQQAAFNSAIADVRKASEGTTREQKIKDELDLQKTLGIGTFEKQQQQMYEDNKARQAKIEAGRGERDFLAQLAAYSRPGANFSQVVERDIASKSAALLEDERFANAQNKLLTDIQSTAEARRVGTAGSIRTAEAAEKKTKQEMLTFIMKEMGVNLQVAQKILGDTLQAQVQMRGQDAQERVGMANASAKVEIANAKAEMAAERLKATLAGADVANKIKLSNSDPYKKLEARIAGLDQNIKYQTNPDGTPKDVEKVTKYKNELADLRTQQATMATNILGGSGISTLPASAPPPGAVREVKK
jgi:ribosomal protein L29